MKILFVKMVWLYTGLFSWPGEKTEKHNAIAPFAHSTLVIRYYESKVFPVIITARQRFEKELSEEEKRTVKEAQVYLKGLMEKEQVNIQNKRLVTKALIDQLRDVLNRHKKNLDSIQEQLYPEYKQWQADINEILALSETENRRSYVTSISPIHFLLLNSDELIRAYFIGTK